MSSFGAVSGRRSSARLGYGLTFLRALVTHGLYFETDKHLADKYFTPFAHARGGFLCESFY